MSYVYTEGAAGDVTASDDGTYIKLSSGGTDLLRVKKSDGDLEIEGGFVADQDI